MASVSSVASFERVDEQQVTEEEVRLAEQELEANRACDAAVRAGLCLEESSGPKLDSLPQALSDLETCLEWPFEEKAP